MFSKLRSLDFKLINTHIVMDNAMCGEDTLRYKKCDCIIDEGVHFCKKCVATLTECKMPVKKRKCLYPKQWEEDHCSRHIKRLKMIEDKTLEMLGNYFPEDVVGIINLKQ